MDFKEQLNYYINYIENITKGLFAGNTSLQREVYEAMDYSLSAGGKRLRPVLVLASCELLGGHLPDAARFAAGIECIHTYSLIHDDLPCMDDDDLRRGRPTCHRQFGEATALLAGDGLLTYAFEYMTDFEKFEKVLPGTVLKIVKEIAHGAGSAGMIGGQAVDLAVEGKVDASEETLTYMHKNKTGQLIRVSVMAGALCAGADENQLRALERFADNLGLAFQIQDDILDCVGSTEVLGKPIGSDAENEKTTYVTLLGLEGARSRAKELTDNAVDALKIFGGKAEFLIFLTNLMNNREC